MKNLTNYNKRYEEFGCVQMESILSDQVLDYLARSFDQKFESRRIFSDEASEFSVAQPVVNIKLDVIFNSPDFLAMMSLLTGKQIKFTRQRLYYTDVSCDPLPWHDDSYDKDSRVAAIRFELSDEKYEGGGFYFRDAEKEYFFENLKFGESVFFKIAYTKFFHRVAPITKGVRKSLILFLCE